MKRVAGADNRTVHQVELESDLVVVGGGMAGTTCALTAARQGLRVTLIQDRPILGGNASSEVRLWILGATAHMGNNNRWAREGGIVDELLVENMYRNQQGNPLIFDTILLEKVVQETGITLLLNTAVFDVEKSGSDTISAVRAFCSQNSTFYYVRAPLFCDASGDGIVGFLSGAAFRMGAETADEFGEKLAPSEEYGQLLGHSIYFYSKDVGVPVDFVAPSFALDDIRQIPRYRNFNTAEDGCRLWWIEYGGRLDTVHDTEKIKWELWKIVYGVWDYIKNSGNFPEAETLTLEWVGHIPGKRESRRFEGDKMLTQQDIVEQRHQDDAVAHGGWALDLHPADGIYSEKPGCDQWHSRGVYQIPYRALYSRNIDNLFLAGRIMSVSHVAFGSTRVQATLAAAAQATGMAAALCIEHQLLPADLAEEGAITILQQALLRTGQHIPGLVLEDPDDLVGRAQLSASSRLILDELPAGGPVHPLEQGWAQMLPVPAGPAPRLTFTLDVIEAGELTVELRTSDCPTNYTPDVTLASRTFQLEPGVEQPLVVEFDVDIDHPRYLFATLLRNPAVAVHTSEMRVTGVLSVTNQHNPAVSNFGQQKPEQDIGIENFEFWTPQRRPAGHNLALKIEPPLDLFGPENIRNGLARPTNQANAWVASGDDPTPALELKWSEHQRIGQVVLNFDTDFDHPMEHVLRGHPERTMPFCVKRYRIRTAEGEVVAEVGDNHQTRNEIYFEPPLHTDCLELQLVEMQGDALPALFEVRCYAPD